MMSSKSSHAHYNLRFFVLSHFRSEEGRAIGLTTGGWLIILVTIFQKIVVPGTGRVVWLASPVMLLLLIRALWRRALVLDELTAALYVALFCLGLCSTLVGQEKASLPSLILLAFFHVFYIFRYTPDACPRLADIQNGFIQIMVFCSACGVVQFFAQFAVGRDIPFFVDLHLPSELIVQNFNNLNPLEYGSTIIKSNGVFFQEPSTFSQFIAIAVVCEACGRFRLWVMGTFALALAVSFSGTGLIVLAGSLPIALARRPLVGGLIAVCAGLAVMTVVATTNWFDIFVERSAEFSRPGTSGYARFVSGFILLDDHLLNQDWYVQLFGNGPGTVREYFRSYAFEVFAPTPIKVVYDYGFLGGFFYLIFMTFIIMRSRASLAIRLAIWLTFMAMGEHSLIPTIHCLILVLLAWPIAADQAAAPASAPGGRFYRVNDVR